MSFETLMVEKKLPIGWIALNRPDHFNTFSTPLATELNQSLIEMDHDPDIRVVVVKGAGKVFSTGIDLSEFPGKSPLGYQEWISLMDRMHVTIATMKKPVVAMVHRYAVANGAGLLLAADFALASEGTQIGTTAINVGLLCTGPIIPVAYTLGKKKSLEMLLMGDMITATEALELGLINRVTPPEKLEEETTALAMKLAEKSPVAMQLGKQFYYKMLDMPFHQRFDYSSEVFSRLCTTEDAKEGIAAFYEKRKPQWKGR